MTTTTATVTTQQGTVEHIDPNVIVVEANVRTEAKLDPEFLASFKQNGVLTPILARRDEQGNVVVRHRKVPYRTADRRIHPFWPPSPAGAFERRAREPVLRLIDLPGLSRGGHPGRACQRCPDA